MLDLGSGRGKFLFEAASEGVRAVGLETNPDYIKETRERAAREGVSVEVVEGQGEALPFPDASFGFANVCEVVEHVASPEEVLKELFRVLSPGGAAYVSAPNRFSIRDPHFHLLFVNWLPRAWADAFIRLCGREKDYEDTSAGHQRLADMHYYTLPQAVALAERAGFKASDIRALRIKREYKGLQRAAAVIAYRILRPWYFDSFHLLLEKP